MLAVITRASIMAHVVRPAVIRPAGVCVVCGVKFSRNSDLRSHIRTVHARANIVHICAQCGAVFNNLNNLRAHRANHLPQHRFQLIQHAFRKKCKLYRKYANVNAQNQPIGTIAAMFLQVHQDLQQLLNYEIGLTHKIKCAIVVMCEMIILDANGGIEDTLNLPIRTVFHELYNDEDVYNFIHTSQATCEARLDDFVSRGSRWQINEVLFMDVEMGHCIPLAGACGKLQIKFPTEVKRIKEKLTCSEKTDCFLRAIACYFTKSSENSVLEKFIYEKIKMNMTLPFKLRDITKFEILNSHLDMKIHVLYAEDTFVYPVHVSKTSATHIITLLLYTVMHKENTIDDLEELEMRKDKCVQHYSLVEDVTKFMRTYYHNKDGKLSRSRERAHYCHNCLNSVPTMMELKLHEELCLQQKSQLIKVPTAEENILQFTNFNNKFPLHFVGIADFESILKSPRYACDMCKVRSETEQINKKCTHKTLVDNNQEPFMYNLIIVNQHEQVCFHKTYYGEDCAANLLTTLLNLEDELAMHLLLNMDMRITKEDFIRLNVEKKVCHICEKDIIGVAHRDHDHITQV